jgi:mono/diheme cytochrome c family protein
VVLPKEPTALASLLALKDKAIEERLERLDELIVWKGKKGYEVAEVQPLTKEEQELFEAGRTLYVTICGACHQPNGQGLEGLAPPLVDSEWVTGSEERLTRLVLQGVRGPITVNGKVWNMDMPPLNILDDAQLAAVMTFIRREWGHTAPPIKEDTVKRIREATIDREEAWTEAELLKIP